MGQIHIRRWVEGAYFLLTMLGFAAVGNTSEPIGKFESVGKIHVGYADLDLHRATDVQVLWNRIVKAGYDACGGNPKSNRRYLDQKWQVIRTYEECRTEAIREAVTRFNFEPLSRLYVESVKLHAASHTDRSAPCTSYDTYSSSAAVSAQPQ